MIDEEVTTPASTATKAITIRTSGSIPPTSLLDAEATYISIMHDNLDALVAALRCDG